MKSAKMLIAAAVVALTSFVQAAETATPAKAEMTIVEARDQISAVIETPSKMTAIMKKLSPEDQKQFVAEVNRAIASLPDSPDEKAAKYLSVNRAALDGASQGNLMTIVAEIFATASVESLTVINERFAADVFNRAADPNVTYTDEQFKKIAASVMATVNERVATADNGDVRAGFAGLMLIRASNSTDAAMVEAVVAMLPESAQTLARDEWYTPALAEGAAQSYEPMLGMADVGEQPRVDVILTVTGVMNREAMLSDLMGTTLDAKVKSGLQMPVWDAVQNPLNVLSPHPAKAGMANMSVIETSKDAETLKKYEDSREPRGYQWQTR